ncbi:MAG: outer membrane beta-barrel protein [Acidobacteriota bacterium]
MRIDKSSAAIPRQQQVFLSTPWLLMLLIVLSLAFVASASAQQRGSFEIGLGIAALELDDKLGGDTGLGMEGRLGYFVTERFQLEIQHSSASAILDGSFQATTLNGLFDFGRDRRFFSPYVLLGVGRAEVRLDRVIAGDATDDALALRAALGVRLDLGANDRTSLRLEVTGLREEAFGSAATHVGLSSTFFWRFGGQGR